METSRVVTMHEMFYTDAQTPLNHVKNDDFIKSKLMSVSKFFAVPGDHSGVLLLMCLLHLWSPLGLPGDVSLLETGRLGTLQTDHGSHIGCRYDKESARTSKRHLKPSLPLKGTVAGVPITVFSSSILQRLRPAGAALMALVAYAVRLTGYWLMDSNGSASTVGLALGLEALVGTHS